MDHEPSLLDYLKSLFNPRKKTIELPELDDAPRGVLPAPPSADPLGAGGEENAPDSALANAMPAQAAAPQPDDAEPWAIPPFPFAQIPWRMLLALVLALGAQGAMEPPAADWKAAIWIYIIAILLAVWGVLIGEWQLPKLPQPRNDRATSSPINNAAVLWALPVIALSFWIFADNKFTPFNLTVWVIALVLTARIFWVRPARRAEWGARISRWARASRWDVSISRWGLLIILAVVVILFYRYYRLGDVPSQMFSDHAEKLQDVLDVLNGETRIFFPRNTGREALQMYLTAFFVQIGFGISFMALKMGTVTLGTISLPFIYLLGKELANKRVGLLAMFLAGISYWFNVISRVALRFALYPALAAPTLYFIFRGLRRQNRNDFIWAGIFLGIGLHGYSPFRLVPVLVVIVIGLYALHRGNRVRLSRALTSLIVVISLSVVVFLPLARYATETEANRQSFSYRSLTRLSTVERAFPGDPVEIFFGNLWDAMTMMAWDNGETWVHSVTHRPAVDVVSGVMFYLGFFLILTRYVRERNWEDVSLLAAVPLLLMPSVLSLAFPDENPSLNRTGGALIPVFIIAAFAFDSILLTLRARLGKYWGGIPALVLLVGFLGWSMRSNYDLVFYQYYTQFRQSAWNTTELGEVIRDFSDSVGSESQAWVIPWPHWVDTRLVGINAGVIDGGIIIRDYAINRDNLPETANTVGVKLFLFNLQDEETLTALQELYPNGALQVYDSTVQSKDFYIYLVSE